MTLLVDPLDVEALADGMRRANQDGTEREELRERGRVERDEWSL